MHKERERERERERESIVEMDFFRKLSFLVFLLCILISLKREGAETRKNPMTVTQFISDTSVIDEQRPISSFSLFSSNSMTFESGSLEYDFYRESCPLAEKIIRAGVQNLNAERPGVAPALLRLVFHDCFVEGCDASVLLDPSDEIESEKETPPNVSLKGFEVIDMIKSEVEEACPGVVSCADILVLSARESVVLSGGPFYPLQTGRRDSLLAFSDIATFELPRPQDDLPKAVAAFASRGFDERETVSLLGSHSIGRIHCNFFLDRLFDFQGTNKSDPSLNPEFLNILKTRCNGSHNLNNVHHKSFTLTPSLAPSAEQQIYVLGSGSPSPSMKEEEEEDSMMEMEMEYNGGHKMGFGTQYYRRLLQGRGILFVDQQLTAGEETATWVRAYASDVSLFRKDFAQAMMKLSNLRVLTASMGQIRSNCSKVN